VSAVFSAFLLTFAGLFPIVNPIEAAPFFLATKVVTTPPGNDGRLALPRGVREGLRVSTGDEVAILPV